MSEIRSETAMDPEAVRAYRDRWKRVAEWEAEEARTSTIEERWRQFHALVGMAEAMGLWPHSDPEEELAGFEAMGRLRRRLSCDQDHTP